MDTTPTEDRAQGMKDTTFTGRISSDAPPLQNIPIHTEEGSAIKSALKSALAAGSNPAADYTAIENRMLAHTLEKEEHNMTDTPEFPITLPADDPLAVEALDNEDRQEALEKTMAELISATIAIKMSIAQARRNWWKKVDERFGTNSRKSPMRAAISPRGVVIRREDDETKD